MKHVAFFFFLMFNITWQIKWSVMNKLFKTYFYVGNENMALSMFFQEKGKTLWLGILCAHSFWWGEKPNHCLKGCGVFLGAFSAWGTSTSPACVGWFSLEDTGIIAGVETVALQVLFLFCSLAATPGLSSCRLPLQVCRTVILARSLTNSPGSISLFDTVNMTKWVSPSFIMVARSHLEP